MKRTLEIGANFSCVYTTCSCFSRIRYLYTRVVQSGERKGERERGGVHTRRCVAVTQLGSGIMDESETFEEKEVSRNGW